MPAETLPFVPTKKSNPIYSNLHLSSTILPPSSLTSTFSSRDSRWWTRHYSLATSHSSSTVLSTLASSIVSEISFHPRPGKTSNNDSVLIASGPRVGLYQLTGSKASASRYIPAPAPIRTVTYRHDGRLACLGGDKGVLKVIDVGTRATVKTFGGGGSSTTTTVRSVAWLPDGLRVVSGGDDGIVRVDHLSDDDGAGMTLRGHDDAVRSVICVGGSTVVSGSYDHCVRVWDGTSGECLNVMNHGCPVERVVGFRVGEEMRIVSVGGCAVKVWDGRSGMLLGEDSNSHAKTISCVVAISPRQLGGLVGDGTETTGEDDDDDAASSPRSGWKLITGGIDGLIRVYDAATLKCVHGIKYPHPVSALGMSADGSRLIIGSAEGTIDVRTRASSSAEGSSGKLTSKKRPLKGGTMAYFMRGVNSAPDPDDYTVVVEKKKKLKRHDTALKQFRYADALDDALATKDPKAVSAILEELSKRRGLYTALSNRDDETLEPILAFTARYIGNGKYTPLLIGVAHALCDIYAGVVGQSPQIDELFEKLKKCVSAEVESQKELAKVCGIVDLMLYSSAE